jgi:hypothetical protein
MIIDDPNLPKLAFNPVTRKNEPVVQWIGGGVKAVFKPSPAEISIAARKKYLAKKATGYERYYMVNASDRGERVVLLSKDITPTDKLVWSVYRSSIKDNNRVCFQADIIECLGLSATYVSMATAKLVKLGFLGKEGKEYFLPKQYAYRGSRDNFNK